MNRAINLFILAIALIVNGCQHLSHNEETTTIFVSIAPLRTIVEHIIEDDFPVEVLVPVGVAAESYEPTPKQIIELNQSQMIFSIGLLPFEDLILKKIYRNDKVVNLSEDVDLIAGECNHRGGGCSNHGVDPHIWTSPQELQIMAKSCYDHIIALYPDSTKYKRNYIALQQELEQLDVECRATLLANNVQSIFIYHPAMTYYARAYGIDQISIEDEGKEPSAKSIARLIERGRREGVTKIFYQSQFPVTAIKIVAKDLGAQCVEIDPLAEDLISNIRSITRKITEL